jgi:hypothetical protein
MVCLDFARPWLDAPETEDVGSGSPTDGNIQAQTLTTHSLTHDRIPPTGPRFRNDFLKWSFDMLNEVKSAMGVWMWQVRKIVDSAFTNLEPREYLMLLLFAISVGYVLLKGRA